MVTCIKYIQQNLPFITLGGVHDYRMMSVTPPEVPKNVLLYLLAVSFRTPILESESSHNNFAATSPRDPFPLSSSDYHGESYYYRHSTALNPKNPSVGQRDELDRFAG
jgi:hypothetical protein